MDCKDDEGLRKTCIASYLANANDQMFDEHTMNSSEKDDIDVIFEFSYPHNVRMEALKRCYVNQPDVFIDIIHKLTSIYNISNVSLIRKFLNEVANIECLPLNLRLDITDTLIHNQASFEIGMNTLSSMIHELHVLPSPYRLQLLIRVARYNQNIQPLVEMLNDPSINEMWRLKSIQSLEHSLSVSIMLDNLAQFISSENNSVRAKILASQTILSVKDVPDTDTLQERAEEYLLSICTIHHGNYRERADAADVLLNISTKEHVRKQALEVLNVLSGNIVNIYKNKENVHNVGIEESALRLLKFLQTFQNLITIPTFDTARYQIELHAKRKYRPYTEEVIKNAIQKVYSEEKSEEEDAIHKSLLRIEIDKTIFGKLNYTLKRILALVYAHIERHDYPIRSELYTRLLEELIEMSDTCASGYMTRLANVLSGFRSYLGLTISWKDQIISNLSGRLNAKLRKLNDYGSIVNDMTNKDLIDRVKFNEFLIEHLPSVREEMYAEFHEYVDDSDWEQFFMEAILHYSGEQ